MAGIGDALAMMFAGGASEYAGNRATEIRDEDKARLQAAREEKLMALQQKYQTSEREATQGWQSEEAGKDRGFKTSEREASQAFDQAQQARSQGFQAGENAKDRSQREALAAAKAAAKEGEVGPNGKRVKSRDIIKGDAIEGTPDRVMFTYYQGEPEIYNMDDLKGGKNYAANQVAPKAAEFAQDVANISRDDKESATTKAAKPEAADKPMYTPQQQSMINKVRTKYPNASDDEVIGALRNNPQTAPLFK